VHRDADLMQVVLRRHARRGLADLLDGGQQQADQNGDDGDHHQKLDQREAGRVSSIGMTADHENPFAMKPRMRNACPDRCGAASNGMN
jgi:hypothetical protein